ncbi:hypothetical protein D9756_010739 [Leucocoprinus leucothites]|uniref:HTH CENPB-type domain-containing protein n=1 Tax=Leucocoprinus leucothites TaxID=201217 RepID=A0A8H5CVL9_9AGAR|nr:hypothetical protein D9756_010739 [Leucoagaricus leucothites]
MVKQLKMDSNAERRWLSDEEEEVVIHYTQELAKMGFGLDHRCLKEHVDEICRTQYGSKFPEAGVRKNWTYHFVGRYTANPATHKEYFDLVEEVQLQGDNGGPIAPECTWAMDESGFQANGAEGAGGQKIIGPK